MSPSWKPWVKANLPHFVCLCHEKVDDGICYDTVGESLDDMVVSIPDVQAVTVLPPFLHGNGMTICGSVTCYLPHCTANLKSKQ